LFKKEIALYSEIQMEHKGEAFDCSTWWYTQSQTRLKCFTFLRDSVLSPANIQTSVNFYQHPSVFYTSTTLENADEDCKERGKE